MENMPMTRTKDIETNSTGKSALLKRIAVSVAAVACALACLFALPGCASGDANTLVGEWKIQNTDVTVVFTGSEFKLVGNTFDYKIDTSDKTITYMSGDATGSAKYSFSDDGKMLTLEENDGAGGTKVTVFDKVSDDGNAEPSANGIVEDE